MDTLDDVDTDDDVDTELEVETLQEKYSDYFEAFEHSQEKNLQDTEQKQFTSKYKS